MDQILPIDVVVVWPQHLDFPLWREYIHNDRAGFKKVIIAFTDMNVVKDNRQFIKDVMAKDKIHFVESDKPQADKDWRNVAVNKALELSDAPWVLFTEEDFIITNINTFWNLGVRKRIKEEDLDVLVYKEGERPHPAFMLVKRELIDKTRKDFSVIPDEADHFYKFFLDLSTLKAKVGYFSQRFDFYHLNGLSQNMYLLQTGQVPNFRPDDFRQYLWDCLNCDILIQPEFITMAQDYVDNH